MHGAESDVRVSQVPCKVHAVGAVVEGVGKDRPVARHGWRVHKVADVADTYLHTSHKSAGSGSDGKGKNCCACKQARRCRQQASGHTCDRAAYPAQAAWRCKRAAEHFPRHEVKHGTARPCVMGG